MNFLKKVLKKKLLNQSEDQFFLRSFIDFIDYYYINELTLIELRAYFENKPLKRPLLRVLFKKHWFQMLSKTELRLSFHCLKKIFLKISEEHPQFYSFYVLMKNYHPFPKKDLKIEILEKNYDKKDKKLLAFFVKNKVSLKDLLYLKKNDFIIDQKVFKYKKYLIDLPDDIENLLQESEDYIFSQNNKPLKYGTLVKRVYDLKR